MAFCLWRHPAFVEERSGVMEGNRMRVIRAERRMTQLTLAMVTRIHPTRVWKIENAYAEPNRRERQAIAAALGSSEWDVWPRAVAPGTADERNPRHGAGPAQGR